MPIDYGTNNVSTSGSLAISNLRINNNIIGVKTNNQDIQILSSGNGNVYLGPIYTDGINAFVNPKADSGFDVTVRKLYISEGLGFYETGDIQGDAIVFDKGGLTSHSLRVNNGSGNGGSIFKAQADAGVEMQGVVKIDKLGGAPCSLTVDGLGKFNEGISNSTVAVFRATDNQPPESGFATLDTRNSIAVLDFDDTTKETAVFVSVMPQLVPLGSGLSVNIHWMATTATSGNCRWEVALERSNTDLDSNSFDTAATGSSTTNNTAGIVTVTSITLTTIDSVAAGNLYRLGVSRDAANGADTMVGDAELVAVEIRSVG